jgi:hypothetical protein
MLRVTLQQYIEAYNYIRIYDGVLGNEIPKEKFTQACREKYQCYPNDVKSDVLVYLLTFRLEVESE